MGRVSVSQFVHLSICLSVHRPVYLSVIPSAPTQGHPARPEAQPARFEASLARSEAQPARPKYKPATPEPGLSHRQARLESQPATPEPGLSHRPGWHGLWPCWAGLRPGWLGLRPGWLGLRPGWMAQRGNGWMEVRTYVQTYIWYDFTGCFSIGKEYLMF